jgi:MscS family membrane protein
MGIDAVWNWIKSLNAYGGWVVQVFAVVFIALLLNLVVKLVVGRLYRKLQQTANPWDDALVDALGKPLNTLIWILGIALAAQIVQQEAQAAIFEAVGPARDLGVIVTITWFLIRLVRRIEANIVAHREAAGVPVDHTTVDALGKLTRASILITAALVALQTLGFSVSGVLAFGGIGGLAVGFAAKDLLSNFFGGLMVYLDRPFAVGDWVRSPDRNIEGTVEEIGWRLTRIRTFDKRPLYVPNATFANIAVENPSRMSHRRIYETVGVRYDDAAKLRGILADVKQMLMDHPEIDQSQTLIVNFNQFASSSLDFFVYTFTRTTNWVRYHEVKEDVLLKILDIVDGHGAEVAFPTSTIHVPDALRLENVTAEGLDPDVSPAS